MSATQPAVLYEHRIFCLTEDAWVYLWKGDTVLLTTCPNNPAHTVLAGSASIINQVSTGIVTINKQPGFAVGTHVALQTVTLDAPASGSAQATATWPVNIAIYRVRVGITTQCVGCKLTAQADPHTTVGLLQAPVSASATVLSVTPATQALLAVGLNITLAQLVIPFTTQEVGRLLSMDTVNNTITVEIPTSTPFAASTTAIQATGGLLDQMEMTVPNEYLAFGEDMSVATQFAAGRVLFVKLDNPLATPAHLVLYISYAY